MQFAEQLHDQRAGTGVQGPGGLVRQQDRRTAHDGTRDGDALPLASRELMGPVTHPVTEADPVQRGLGPLPSSAPGQARVEQAIGDVVHGPGPFGEVELLEDETDAVGAQRGQGAVVEPVHLVPVHDEAAPAGAVQGADQVQQCGFAGPGRPDDGDQLTGSDGRCHLSQGMHLVRS